MQPSTCASEQLTCANEQESLQNDPINGDKDTSELLAVGNHDPDIYATILDVDGATFRIVATGAMPALARELGARGPHDLALGGSPAGSGGLVEAATVFAPVPEPSTFLLFGLGLAMMLIRCRSSSQMVGRPKGDSR